MGKVNSKQKGSRFERSICKFFQDWTGYEFSRVPASGGLRWKKTDNITSDITCSDPKHSRRFSLSVECKSYQEIKFEHLLLGNKLSILSKTTSLFSSIIKLSFKNLIYLKTLL